MGHRAETRMQLPLAELERTLIDAYLHDRGVDRAQLAAMPAEARERLLGEASRHASARLAEVEARSHYIDDIHE